MIVSEPPVSSNGKDGDANTSTTATAPAPHTPDGVGSLVANSPPSSTTPKHLNLKGNIRIGRQFDDRDRFDVLENPDLRKVLETSPTQPDTVIEALPGAEITIVDIDCHHWSQPPSDEELTAHMGAVNPLPDVQWVSHGKGYKLVFIGPYHRARALKAAFSVPIAFNVELLTCTRHPLTARSDKPGAVCGPVIFNDTDPSADFKFRMVGGLTPELRVQALEKLGMVSGGRYDHDQCPIESHVESGAKKCVVVLENGVFCHRCANRGIAYRDTLAPGFVPYSAIIGNDTTVFDHLVGNRVHWTHAALHLGHIYPNIGTRLLREAYLKTLEAEYGSNDPRVKNVFNGDLDFLRGPGVWLNAKTLEVTTMDNDAADGLPYCQTLKTGKDGDVKIKINGVRRSQVKNRVPSGYTPLRPYKGITFTNDELSIPVPALPKQKHKIELLADPLPEDDAFAHFEKSFPLLDRRYLKGCIAAAICAEAGSGPPAMLCAAGPSGAAKGETIRLAASVVGEDAIKVQLDDNPEAFMRNIGMLLAAGHRFLVFDEFGKISGLAKKLSSILQIGAVVDWRPLYQNHRIHTPCHAAFFFPCVRFPDFLIASAEFVRRTRHVRLHRKVPNWAMTSGGDTAAWRDRAPENARAANSVLTHVWRTCREHNFRFL
ncbi:MAG: hypothetical protein WCT04_21210 [Planctomycetota bacterium]